MQPDAPDYDDLGSALAVSELSPSASEAQGIYCGLLAAAAPEALQRWLGELLPAVDDGEAVAECRTMLGALAAYTHEQLEGPAREFGLLLPDDDRGLRERAVALHEWTRGFLFGLGLAGVDAAGLSPPAREAFADLLEVTRMDLNDLDDDETNEQALSEVVEYIRVASTLMYEEAMAATSDHGRGGSRGLRQ